MFDLLEKAEEKDEVVKKEKKEKMEEVIQEEFELSDEELEEYKEKASKKPEEDTEENNEAQNIAQDPGSHEGRGRYPNSGDEEEEGLETDGDFNTTAEPAFDEGHLNQPEDAYSIHTQKVCKHNCKYVAYKSAPY